MKTKTSLLFFLVPLAVICVLPFYTMMINATRSTSDIVTGISLFPGSALLDNFKEMQSRVDILGAFSNSFLISISSTILTCYFSAMTAYAFCAYRFKFKGILFVFVLIIMMIPPQLSIIGFYKMAKEMGLLNSFVPLILPSIANAYTVFFVRQYTQTALSQSIVEAARIDGAGEFKIFNKIALPIMSPAIFTMGITSFIASWNNYLMPLILLSETKKFTLPLIIRVLVADREDRSIGGMYLAIAFSIVPMMIVFFIFSRYIIDGVGAGGEKE